MPLLSLINSRHRFVDRYRYLSNINNDVLTSSLALGVSDVVIEFDSIINGSSGFYIINRLGASASGFLLRIFENLTASFGIFGGAFVNFAPITASPNWRNFRFEINTGGNNLVDFYIDNVLHDSISIGAINSTLTNAFVSSTQFDVIIDNLIIDGVEFGMNEKKGFVCNSSDNTETLQGSTSNAAGLTYWESNVIKKRE